MTRPSPEQSASWLSRLCFQWVLPTLKRGMHEPLSVATLLPLNDAENPVECDRIFRNRLEHFQGRTRPILRSMAVLHWQTFARVFCISMVLLVASITSPLLLRQLLRVIGGQSQHPFGTAHDGALIATLLFTATLVSTMAAHHIFHVLLKMMVRVRIGLVAAIYRKALVLTVAARQGAPAGQIINLMGTDAQKFVNALNVIHSVWMHPLQLIAVMVALYWILGSSALVGAALLCGFLYLSALVARRHVRIRKELVRQGDERVGLMNEILMSIRIIKFYAWEKSFIDEVQSIRGREMVQLTKWARLTAIGSLLFLSTPVIVSVATFATFVASGRPLSAADVFPALTLFMVLRQALVMLPNVVATCLEANVAVGRIETFLGLPELAPREISMAPAGTVEMLHATVEWTPGITALHDIQLVVKPGELITVVGAVGSGKSALMSALLGDLTVTSGKVAVAGSMAYVSQQAWILNDTIRSNVIFGLPIDEGRYQMALRVSGLAYDLSLFPQADATEIGERGVNLSGGQRQRISLARAVYTDADVILLDDPLSALDNKVGQQVFDQAILRALSRKTRILVTHRLEYVDGSDRLIVMDQGRIIEQGSPRVLKKESKFFFALWRAYERGRQSEELSVEVSEANETKSTAVQAQAAAPESSASRLMTDEERFTGVVGLDVYKLYFRAFAPGVIATILGAVFIAKELFAAGTDSWLAYWSSSTEFQIMLFLGGYLSLGLAACLTTYGRSLIISLRGLQAGRDFHTRILQSVVRAPMSFFEGTPVGRVLNRFSRDMEAIDTQIPGSLHEALGCVFSVSTTLIVIVAVAPIAMAVIVPIAYIYYHVQRYFRPTAREGQRLDSITRSPIFAQYSESLSGVQVIRAYGAERRFEGELLSHLETNSRSFYTIVSANRWLGMRIESLGALIVAAAAFAAVFTGTAAHAGFWGLAITYALSITGAMNWAVRMFSQLESNLNSVERVDFYSKLPAEHWEGEVRPAGWPTVGGLVFEGLELRYRPDLPPVIKGLSLEIRAGEKVGIVGRTGSGKSTLLLGLFRIVEPSQGRILIDGVDTSRMGLSDLRSALSIIPQEPVLFRGSIRKNLDPFREFSDDTVWDALEKAEIKSLVKRLPSGLDTDVHDGGSNFSVGQRQLLCLARAVLKKSRILLMDEATASVDVTTDALIQRTVRSTFADATVLTIAHRLGTVMDCDRIIVLESGRVVEFDSPSLLARERTSMFAALLREEHQPA